jgi:hypothetical protein
VRSYSSKLPRSPFSNPSFFSRRLHALVEFARNGDDQANFSAEVSDIRDYRTLQKRSSWINGTDIGTLFSVN